MAGAQGTSADYSAPPSPPRGSGAPAEGLPPHTPEAGVPQASHTGLPKLSSRYAAGTHGRRLAMSSCVPPPQPEQLARPLGGPRVGRGSAGPGCPAALGPPTSPACVSPVVDVLGTLLVEHGQALVSQRIWRDKASQCFAGCLALDSRVVNMLFMAPS